LQYGLANHELKHLAYDLKHMKHVIDYTANSNKMSTSLYKSLGTEQKATLKSVIKKQAKDLIKDKTITSIKLV
jgi:hypothetical protein